jgi:hypothetical protein
LFTTAHRKNSTKNKTALCGTWEAWHNPPLPITRVAEFDEYLTNSRNFNGGAFPTAAFYTDTVINSHFVNDGDLFDWV